jgi:hypothetical protein
MRRPRILVPLVAAAALAAASGALLPRALDAGSLLYAADDPEKLADRAVTPALTAPVAEQEITAALAANDPNLAASFVDLAHDHGIAVDPALAEKVAAANSTAANAARSAGSFSRGLITGEPDDMVGVAGMALGDLFVFGDIRDAAREGLRYARGEPADTLVLGLACVGLAVTAGTYATLGAGTPARVGLTLVKAARKTGRLSARLAQWITRSLRSVVDMGALRRALATASLSEPAVAVRAARDAVKIEKAGGLTQLVRNVGRVEAKAGTQGALDALKVSEGPRDVARVAQLAEAKGSKTRAILKLGGRAAIALTTGVASLLSWVAAVVMTLLGFVMALKRTTERCTERVLHWRKTRRARRRMKEALAQANG